MTTGARGPRAGLLSTLPPGSGEKYLVTISTVTVSSLRDGRRGRTVRPSVRGRVTVEIVTRYFSPGLGSKVDSKPIRGRAPHSLLKLHYVSLSRGHVIAGPGTPGRLAIDFAAQAGRKISGHDLDGYTDRTDGAEVT